MFARRGVLATRVQATAIYFEFLAGTLKATRGTSLTDFPEVEKYPDTEKSKEVAASVRASVNFLYGLARTEHPTEWPIEFWNRGLELEGCIGLSTFLEENNEQADG